MSPRCLIPGLVAPAALLLALCEDHPCDAAPSSGFVAGPNSPIAVGRGPGAPAVSDFNGDAKPDIALLSGSRSETRAGHNLLILLNDGAARFSASPAGRIDVGESPSEVATADFSGDGNSDIAVMSHDSYLVHLFLGDGKGGMNRAPGSPFPAHNGARPHTHALVAADVNADGRTDLLTTNAADDAISILLNNGGARFTAAPGSPFPAPRHPYSSLAVRDLNGDGHIDVAAPLLESGEIGVYLGDGTGRFSPAPGAPYRVAARPGFVHADDLNGDGRPDLLATHDDVGMVDVLLNDGGGRFRFAPGSPVRTGPMVWGIITDDFDGDGDRDAILNTNRGRSLVLILGDGRGGFTESDGAALETGDAASRLVCVDLNGDGRKDIVATNEGSGDVTVLLRR